MTINCRSTYLERHKRHHIVHWWPIPGLGTDCRKRLWLTRRATWPWPSVGTFGRASETKLSSKWGTWSSLASTPIGSSFLASKHGEWLIMTPKATTIISRLKWTRAMSISGEIDAWNKMWRESMEIEISKVGMCVLARTNISLYTGGHEARKTA